MRKQLLGPPAAACPHPTLQAFGCVLYASFILSHLCVPAFANMSREPFSTRSLVLSILHSALPGESTRGTAASLGPGSTVSCTLHQVQHLLGPLAFVLPFALQVAKGFKIHLCVPST